jgi:hypothetical protein
MASQPVTTKGSTARSSAGSSGAQDGGTASALG